MKPTRLSKLLFAFLLACALTGDKAGAQINYTGGMGAFSATNNGTLSPGLTEFYDPGGTVSPCGFGYVYWGGAGTNNYLDPFAAWSSYTDGYLGNTLGGAITVSFNYYQTGGANAKLELFHGPTQNGPWTLVPNAVPAGGLGCANATAPSFTFAEPGPVWIRFKFSLVSTSILSNCHIDLSDIAATEAPLPVCSGVPTAGTTIADLPPGCGVSNYPLTVSPSPNQAGLAYQWEQSANGTTWTNIAGATTKYTSVSQTAATYYRRKVTCAGSGLSSWSSPVLVTQASPALPCYCASGAFTSIGSDITNVTLGTLNNSSNLGSLSGTQGTASGTASQYSNFTGSTAPIPNLLRGVPIPVSASFVALAPVSAFTKIYIDYNQDGDLDDADEMAYSGGIFLFPDGTVTGTITVPSGAALGNTLMRVVMESEVSSLSDVSPCGTYERGETEDYRVNILPTTNCGGMPATPVATGPAAVCNMNGAIALNATNLPATTVTAIGYQWQKSPAGAGSWTAIAGATTVPYTVASQSSATDYRLAVICTATGQSSYSNTVSVATAIGAQCYCIPSGNCGLSSSYISNVTSSGAASNLNNSSGCSGNAYTDFTTYLVHSDSLQTVRLTVSRPAVSTQSLTPNVYVDWNSNGYFTDAGEMVHQFGYLPGSVPGPYSYALSFAIPAGTAAGNYRMRIQGPVQAILTNPCTISTGEVEDYTLVVTPPAGMATVPTCTGMPNAGVISANGATTAPCAMPARTLNAAGYTAFAAGIAMQWQESPDGVVFTNIGGATATTYTTAPSGTTKHYRAKTTCATSGLVAYSNTIVLTVSVAVPALAITPATAAFCPGSGGVQLSASGADAYSWTPATGLSCTTCANPIANPDTTITYTVTGTNGGVCSTTASQVVTVNPRPFVASASAAPAAPCPGGAVDLSAQAWNGAVSGFAGYYAPAQWATLITNSNGAINATGAPSQVAFTSPNNGTGTNGNHRWAIVIPVSGNVTFDWSYAGPAGGAADDQLTYRFGTGALNQLPGFSTAGPVIQSGTATIPVTAGTLFSFQVRSLANTGGSATVTVSNFSAPGISGNTIQWYDAPTGGNAISTTAIAPGSGPATYYAGAVNNTTGCSSATRMPVTVTTDLTNVGRWLGTASAAWSNGANWCGGVPTATTDILIPDAATVPNMPMMAADGYAHNINLQPGAALALMNDEQLNLHGNITGAGTLNAANGSIAFAGNGPQSIAPPFTTQTLTVDGGGAKTLGGAVTLTGGLQFNNGLLDVGGNTLSMGTATITGANENRYVRTSQPSGRLARRVTTGEVVFPVGNATYNPARISNTGTPDTFAVGVRDEVLTEGTSGAAIDPTTTPALNQTWDIEESTPGGSNAALTLQWNAANTNSFAFDFTNVYVSHYTGGGWDKDPAYPNVNNTPTATGWPGSSPYSAARTGLTSFSPFTVGSAGGAAPLPVTLVSIQANNEGSRNRIAWESATEHNTDYYVVERSNDGLTFSRMGELAAQGKAFGYITYDHAPANGFTYYRLKMVDQNGSFAYSPVVKAWHQAGGGLVLEAFPNPVRDVLAIRTYGSDAGALVLSSAAGQPVATGVVSNGAATISTRGLGAGIYLLRFTDGRTGGVKTMMISKQ